MRNLPLNIALLIKVVLFMAVPFAFFYMYAYLLTAICYASIGICAYGLVMFIKNDILNL